MAGEKILLYGREFTEEELEDVYYIVNQFTHLSRTGLAKIVCEGVEWKAPNDKYKIDAGRKLLEHLESKGKFTLPKKRNTHPYPNQSYTHFAPEEQTNPGEALNGSVADYAPFYLQAVVTSQANYLDVCYVPRPPNITSKTHCHF